MKLNFILFAIVPYVVLAIELVASFARYFTQRYKISSLSSEFLEQQQLFWGSVPWHYGIMVVLLGHVVAFLFPSEVLLWNSVPVRLLILEATSLSFGLLALIGLIMLIYRRFTNKRIWVVTSKMDIVVLILLLIQVGTGLGIALFCRWGSSWYAAALVPYLKSLFTLSPNVDYLAFQPWWIKAHILNAFAIIGILPFTRLVHFLILPISYIWRSYQVVIWNADRKKLRNSDRRV
jgi:nitrate reductase gamma subunit